MWSVYLVPVRIQAVCPTLHWQLFDLDQRWFAWRLSLPPIQTFYSSWWVQIHFTLSHFPLQIAGHCKVASPLATWGHLHYLLHCRSDEEPDTQPGGSAWSHFPFPFLSRSAPPATPSERCQSRKHSVISSRKFNCAVLYTYSISLFYWESEF